MHVVPPFFIIVFHKKVKIFLNLLKSKSFKSFLDEAPSGLHRICGAKPRIYKIKVKGFFLLTLSFDFDFICGV
jgi:hypothetical protein